MKKLSILVVLAVAVTFAASAPAQISGSAHDFSPSAWSGGEICKPCHIPHNAYQSTGGVSAGAVAPLWNHDDTVATFIPYASPTGTLDATDVGQPTSVSKACLSCHDGTVALDSFGGTTGAVMIDTVGTGSGDLGTDLSNDHPVSFSYNNALFLADGELADPASAPVAALLFAGEMECASCHDVHNSTGFDFMLNVDNTGSALCLTCHTK